MKTLTIRQVPDEIHEALRIKAAEHGRSMEEEVRRLLEAHAGSRRGSRRALKQAGLSERGRSWGRDDAASADRRASVERLHEFVRKLWGGALPGDVVDRFLEEKRDETAREDEKDGF